MTPEETNSPDLNTPDSTTRSDRERHRWERTVPTAGNLLKNAFLGESTKSSRVAPKSRSLQIGTAVAAFGVLGVLTAGTAQTPAPVQQAPAVHNAAQVTPLTSNALQLPTAPSNPLPQPAQAPAAASAPAPTAAPAANPEPQPKDQVDAWIQQAVKVLEQNGVAKDQINADAIRAIILNESNGDPGATNNWDSNAAAGTPSIGLMQTIQPTFDSFAVPGHTNIYDPVDNIVAATRYSLSRYGSMSNVPGIAGLSSGGSYQGY